MAAKFSVYYTLGGLAIPNVQCDEDTSGWLQVMSANVRIRKYEARDATVVSYLIRETMRVSNASDYGLDRLQPLMDYFTPETVEQMNRDRTCFVAEIDRSVVGTAALEGESLVTSFVEPQFQRLGIGAALLEKVENAARQHGLRRLSVHSSLAGASFYETMGYQRTGATVEGTAGPHIEMVKEIQ